MKTVASVQARLGSTRLPGKVLLHLGERRVVQWVLDRAEAATSIDQTVAAIGDQPENEAIIEYCDREEIRSIVGPEENLLARHRTVVDRTDCDLLVRLTGDCPFVPSAEIERIVDVHQDNDARYTTNVTAAMPVGTAVDVIETDVLTELTELGDSHPVERLREEPATWETVKSPTVEWTQYGSIHMAVDTPDDYWQLTDAVEVVGDEPSAVAAFLDG